MRTEPVGVAAIRFSVAPTPARPSSSEDYSAIVPLTASALRRAGLTGVLVGFGLIALAVLVGLFLTAALFGFPGGLG